MATYTELYALGSQGNTTLRNRIAVANHIIAVVVALEDAATPSHAERLKWASSVFSDPDGWATKMLRGVIADNAALTVAAIEGATDAAIKTSCEKLVNAFALAM